MQYKGTAAQQARKQRAEQKRGMEHAVTRFQDEAKQRNAQRAEAALSVPLAALVARQKQLIATLEQHAAEQDLEPPPNPFQARVRADRAALELSWRCSSGGAFEGKGLLK